MQSESHSSTGIVHETSLCMYMSQVYAVGTRMLFVFMCARKREGAGSFSHRSTFWIAFCELACRPAYRAAGRSSMMMRMPTEYKGGHSATCKTISCMELVSDKLMSTAAGQICKIGKLNRASIENNQHVRFTYCTSKRAEFTVQNPSVPE